MLNQISWGAFFGTVALLLFIYYAIVLTVFYKRELLQLVTAKGHSITRLPDHNTETDTDQQQSFKHLPEPILHLMDELSALIRQAGYSRFAEHDTKDAVQKLISLERFQSVKLTEHFDDMNALIIKECKTNCSMHLNEADLQRLWTVEED